MIVTGARQRAAAIHEDGQEGLLRDHVVRRSHMGGRRLGEGGARRNALRTAWSRWRRGSNRAACEQPAEREDRRQEFPTPFHPHKLNGMSLRNTTRRWGAVAQLLHWLIVALIIAQVTLASLADDAPPLRRLGLLAYHKSIGITILALAVLRLAWRWINPTPELPDTLSPFQRVLARFTHVS